MDGVYETGAAYKEQKSSNVDKSNNSLFIYTSTILYAKKSIFTIFYSLKVKTASFKIISVTVFFLGFTIVLARIRVE